MVEDKLSVLLKYHDSEGNRLINFNLPEERKKYELWIQKVYPPRQLSLFEAGEKIE